MIEADPIVCIGDVIISNAALESKSFSEAVGLVISITKENNVYRRSHYVYTILWSDFPEPIEHTEDEVRRWRQRYINTRKSYGI